MTGIRLQEREIRVVAGSENRIEQGRKLQLQAVFMELGLGFLCPICSLSMGEVRKWEAVGTLKPYRRRV